LDRQKDFRLRARKYESETEALEIVVNELMEFCTNRCLFSSPDIQYGSYNKFRQKSVRENYIIHVIIEILKLQLPIDEISDIVRWAKDVTEAQKDPGVVSQAGGNYSHTKYSAMEHEEVDETTRDLAYVKIKDCKNLCKLLKVIATGNDKNQLLIYDFFPSILYMSEHIRDAADLLISIVSENSTLMQRISAEIKNSFNAPVVGDDGFATKETSPGGKGQGMFKKLQTVARRVATDEDYANAASGKNPLNFFLEHIKDKKDNGVATLAFLKTICDSSKSESNFNKEILYSLTDSRPDLLEQLFYKLEISSDQLIVNLSNYIKIPAEEIIGDKNYINRSKEKDYLMTQLELYSHLARNRNYRWKKYLGKIFNAPYLGSQTFTISLDRNLRSILANFMLYLYIDEEPLVKKTLPEMIAVFPGFDDVNFSRKKPMDPRMIGHCAQFGTGTKSYMKKVNQCIYMSYKGIPLPKNS
jgi:hypothetical protein